MEQPIAVPIHCRNHLLFWKWNSGFGAQLPAPVGKISVLMSASAVRLYRMLQKGCSMTNNFIFLGEKILFVSF